MATPARNDVSFAQPPEFDAWLSIATEAVSTVARRRRLSSDFADQLKSDVWFKLASRYDAVIDGITHVEASRSYFRSLTERALLDLRTKEWGKWRPSAQARRLGPKAVRLERLVCRDGVSVGRAIETVAQLGDEAARLPEDFIQNVGQRVGRKRVPAETLDGIPASSPSPEAVSLERERERNVPLVRSALLNAMNALQPADAELIRLRFFCGMRIADIARTLGQEQKPLYRRMGCILDSLRRELAADDVSRDTVQQIGWSLADDEAEAA